MRVSQEEKARSRARIVRSASQLFRRSGVEGASVGDVMKEAGLTHGGFYRHFGSKDALLVAALEDAFAQMTGVVTDGLEEQPASAVRQAFGDFYLSSGHIEAPETGCPAAALGGDIGRAPVEVKAAFGAGLGKMIDAFAEAMEGGGDARNRKATRELAMMVGAVMLARASDGDTGQKILAACRSDV